MASGNICLDSRFQRFQRGKALFITQLVAKHHPQAATVKITAKIQQKAFAARLHALHGRSRTDIGHGWPGAFRRSGIGPSKVPS